MKSLQLNFEQINNENIDKMLGEMKEASPVSFTHTVGGPAKSDVMTKPEYLHVEVQVRLTFESDAKARQFMSTSKCREIFESYEAA